MTSHAWSSSRLCPVSVMSSRTRELLRHGMVAGVVPVTPACDFASAALAPTRRADKVFDFHCWFSLAPPPRDLIAGEVPVHVYEASVAPLGSPCSAASFGALLCEFWSPEFLRRARPLFCRPALFFSASCVRSRPLASMFRPLLCSLFHAHAHAHTQHPSPSRSTAPRSHSPPHPAASPIASRRRRPSRAMLMLEQVPAAACPASPCRASSAHTPPLYCSFVGTPPCTCARPRSMRARGPAASCLGTMPGTSSSSCSSQSPVAAPPARDHPAAAQASNPAPTPVLFCCRSRRLRSLSSPEFFCPSRKP